MSTTIIHDFTPYVPPKPPATLPQPDSTDIGKYLNVDSNVDLVYSAVDNELPTPTAGDNGKFVGVDNAKYKIVNSPLPTVSNTDNGKFLGVSNGSWGKVASPIGNNKEINGIPGAYINFPTGLTRTGLTSIKATDNVVFKFGSTDIILPFQGLTKFRKDLESETKLYAYFSGIWANTTSTELCIYHVLIDTTSGGTAQTDQVYYTEISKTAFPNPNIE